MLSWTRSIRAIRLPIRTALRVILESLDIVISEESGVVGFGVVWSAAERVVEGVFWEGLHWGAAGALLVAVWVTGVEWAIMVEY